MASSKFDGRPDTYRDRDTDQERQFTYVDYSKKTKVSTHMKETEVDVQQDLNLYRESKLKALMALPAVGAVKSHPHLIKRGEGREAMGWNLDTIGQVCSDLNVLYDVYNLTWRRVINPLYWDIDMSFEDVANGGYKQYLLNGYEQACMY